ncbi:MAG: DUF3124 domain-containing protein [Acidobacteria bacterium]|nr:DUF3124 domain-containing protein [Acidobacteriota bacterium]
MRSFQMRWLRMLLVLSVFMIYSCSDTKVPSNPALVNQAGAKKIGPELMKTKSFVAGQIIYVPVYSHIYHQDNMVFDLTATLSIRNTDFNHSLIVKSVKYYNTEGKVVREYVQTPLALPSMATLDFIVGQKDRSGGSGANFIVEWVAENQVAEPIVECIMIGTSGQQGISFLSVGKVVQ